MISNKVGRPAKLQRICSVCKEACSPKNGDWFFFKTDSDEQKFVCKPCENSAGASLRRTTPIRISQ